MVLFAQSHWHKAGGEFAFHGDFINFGKGKELFLDFWSKSYIFNVFLLWWNKWTVSVQVLRCGICTKNQNKFKKKIKYQLDAKLNYNYNYLCCMKYKSDLQKTFDKWKASVVTLKVYTFSYFLVYVA